MRERIEREDRYIYKDKKRHILSVGKGRERDRERERECFETDRELFITGPRVKNNKK